MLYVGIDIAKNKHDCYVLGENKARLAGPITVENNQAGFTTLLQILQGLMSEHSSSPEDVQIGLESTGHYGNNLIHFLWQQGFTIYLLNPKRTADMHKASTLRRTKTDKVDALMLATIVYAERDTLTPYTTKSYHIEQLKSLTRYRSDLVQDLAKLKTSVKRLINILFPEYDGVFSNVHGACSYALLGRYPGKAQIAEANLASLTKLISQATRGRYGQAKAEQIQELAKSSVGMISPVQSVELQDTIERIQYLASKIRQLDRDINRRMEEIKSPIKSIPGIGDVLSAIIIAEISDIRRFSHPDKLVAFAGLSPSTYQSGQYLGTHAKMEKRGSRQLRYAIMLAAEYAARFTPHFARQLHKKRLEGKAYRVAISHVARNLLRLIYHLEVTGELYREI